MELYCTPGGTWAGTEKDYKAALKHEGIDPKTVTRSKVDVPTSKKPLLEFLSFHNVNPIGGPVRYTAATAAAPAAPAAEAAPPPPPPPPTTVSEAADLDALFNAASLGQQLTLAAIACENAFQKIPR